MGVRKAIQISALALVLIVGVPHQLASAYESRFVDFVEVRWEDSPTPKTTLENVIRNLEREVIPNWVDFTRVIGDESAIEFQLGGRLQLPLNLSQKFPCDGIEYNRITRSIRENFYKELAITETGNRHLLVLIPDSGCTWLGRASMSNDLGQAGILTLHNTDSAFVISHELGHNLGLGHSNLLRCASGLVDGPWGSDCQAIEYGGAVDVMGNVSTKSPLSTYHQWRLGRIKNSEIHQSWLSESIELSASDVSGEVRAIFVREGSQTYWIEYRRMSPTFPYSPGLVVFRTDPPPKSAIVSPNSFEYFEDIPGLGVSPDMWMLNMGDFVYSQSGTASGSMSLPFEQRAIIAGGAIEISAQVSKLENSVLVSISRKPDLKPPAKPLFSPFTSWISEDSELLISGYDDGESTISNFETLVDGQLTTVQTRTTTKVVPTFLDPFVSKKNLRLGDLPEGKYKFSVRAVDVWGNKSPWSDAVEIVVDRGFPMIGNRIEVSEVDSDKIRLKLIDFKDSGSQLCRTEFSNADGFINQVSDLSLAPSLSIELKAKKTLNFGTFDCSGNGIEGRIGIDVRIVDATQPKKTGNWIPVSQGGLKGLRCVSKCSASFSVTGDVALLLGKGSPKTLLGGKYIASIADSDNSRIRNGAFLSTGNRSQILRVVGSQFDLYGIVKVSVKTEQVRSSKRSPLFEDPSLLLDEQSELATFGFRSADFANGWRVEPMPRGTTLLDPTLDLCSSDYKSEAGRAARRQVTSSSPSSPYLFLSTEVVRYKSANAATAALNELRKNYESCAQNGGNIEGGVLTPYSFQDLPRFSVKLVAESDRVIVRATIGKGTDARQLLGFYQFSGTMFTGLYVVKIGEKPIDDMEVLRWFDVAEIMSERLRR